MEEKLICIGCGIDIQHKDSSKQGYLPIDLIEKTDNNLICRRCFRIKHHNEVSDIEYGEKYFYDLIKSLSSKNALIVKIVDIFDFSGSWIEDIVDIVGKNKDIVLVANKIDLLPKSVKENKIKQWLYKTVKEKGIKVKDIFLISAVKNKGIENLAQSLDILRKNKDIYIVGATNVGKSTLINKLIELTSGDKNVITTSHYPGTTLAMIKIPLDKKTSIYDTPGIILNYDISHYLDEKSLNLVLPKKEIKPKVFQLNSKQTLFFGGLCRMNFLEGEKQSFTIYLSNELNIHRTKLENAYNLFENHLGELLSPPFKDNLSIFKDNSKRIFNINKKKIDIVISGLGWITINSEKGCKLEIVCPKQIEVFTRNSII